MPRSVALSGLIIVTSLAIVGFAAFSSPTTAPAGIDVTDLDARAAAAVLAAPLAPALAAVAPAPLEVAPTPEAPTPAPAPRVSVATQQQRAPSSTTTTTTTTTVPPTTTTVAATTTTTVPATTTTTVAATTTTTVPATTTTTTTVATTTTVPASTVHPPAVEQWRGLVATYFPASRVEEALRIIDCESNGDPGVTNPASGAAGLFQFIPSTWNSVAGALGLPDYASGAPYDPASNTAAAAWLVQQSIDTNYSKGPWGHWTCRWVLG